MSTLTETAEHEAEEAEAENEDQENADQPEEETQAPEQPAEPPASQMTEKEAERLSKQADRAAATYIDKVMPIAQALGWQVEPCPLCELPGLAQVRPSEMVTSDVESAVLRLIGKSAPRNLKAALDAEVCPDCDGEGDVLTGAKKEIAREKPCTRCGGKGWIQKAMPITMPQANGAPPYPGAGEAFTPLPQGIPDAWGRPAGHVHWGIDPANVGV